MKYISILLCSVLLLMSCGETEAEKAERAKADSLHRVDSLATLIRPRQEPYEAAVAMVKQQLKAPASARFAPVLLRDDTVRIALTGDSLATVYGEYDSQNSFGTYLHGYYKAELKKAGGKWVGAKEYDFQSVQLTDFKPF